MSSIRLFNLTNYSIILFYFECELASVDKYPLTSPPQLFGLHKNAEIGYNNGMVKNILNNLLAVQSMKGEPLKSKNSIHSDCNVI